MQNVTVEFKNSKYDFVTSIDNEMTDEQIRNYYIRNVFNFGVETDDLQECIGVEIN